MSMQEAIAKKNQMKEALAEYIHFIGEDYSRWIGSAGRSRDAVSGEMTKEFLAGLRTKEGKKYIKVMTKSSVHSFIVDTEEDAKFKRGDILMASGWSAPARNFSRGNILEGKFGKTSWTGAQ